MKTRIITTYSCMMLLSISLLASETEKILPPPKIVVVGAGIAGLTAAYRLKKDYGLDAVVYEASDRVGGKIRTENYPKQGVRVELGASFIDQDHTAIRALVAELGLSLTTLKMPGSEKTYVFDGKIRDLSGLYQEFLPTLLRIEQDIGCIKHERAHRKADNYGGIEHLTPTEEIIDKLSIDEYLSSRNAPPLFKTLAEVIHACEFGASTKQLNALMLLDYMTIDLERGHFLIDGKKGDEGSKITGGNSLLPQALAKKLAFPINFEHELAELREEDGSFALTFRHLAEDLRVNADYVILALPSPILRDIKMDQARLLSPDLRVTINDFDYGDVAKFIMVFSAPVWREKTSNMMEVVTDRFSIWDSSFLEDGNSLYHLTVYMGGPEALKQRDPENFASEILHILEPVIPHLKNYYIGTVPSINWSRHPFSKSGFFGPIRPGQWRDRFVFLHHAMGNLVFAGDQWSKEHAGFMNGAVESAITAARYIHLQVSRHRKS
ncbi:MAG TPA: NAD(P)/FAD-dependent oxidoreductase [Myxococcota bacterium]|nr:NAD(P)/FAD-dependent oxidoreductase [Myxococcota bacterium]